MTEKEIEDKIKTAEIYIDLCRKDGDYEAADDERAFWRKLGFWVETMNNKTTIWR